MADEERPLTPEEKYSPKLPKQLQSQVDAVNEAMSQPPESEAAGDDDGAEQDDDQQEDQQEDEGDQGEEPPSQEQETWEQRARSAMGRLDQTLTVNQQLTKRLADIEREMNLMKVSGAQPAQPPVPKAKQQYVKQEEIADYGDEFFDVVGRKAKEELLPVVDDLTERLKRLESGQQAVGKVVEQTQKRGLYDQLYEEIPEWKDINHHPAFINWLAFPDPYSGRQRHEMLKEAFSRHDGDRVVNFFRGFLTEATGTPPNNSRQQAKSAPPLPGNGQASGKPSLEQFAAPGRARSAPQQLPPDKPVYSPAWIAKFFADKRTGKFRGREADADATERDIYQAQHEGRIQ